MKFRILIFLGLFWTGSRPSVASEDPFPRGLGGLEALVKSQAPQQKPGPSFERQDTHLNQTQREAQDRRPYFVHEALIQGNRVREYSLPHGLIFAVTWRGIAQPDLTALLGSYFQEFKIAARKSENESRLTPRPLTSPHLVVERYGHMRDVRGRAYLAKWMPQGLSPEELE